MKKAALLIAACIAAAGFAVSTEVSAEIQVVTKAQNKSNAEKGQLTSEDMILIDLNEYTVSKYRIVTEIPAAGNFKGIKAPEGNEMAVVSLGYSIPIKMYILQEMQILPSF